MKMGILMVAFALAGLGCGKKGGGAEKEFEGYVNEVCACKDMKCITDAGAKYAEKHKNDKPAKGDAKPSKKMVELTAKMADCNKKIMEEEMKKTAPPPVEPPPVAQGPKWADVTQEQCEKAARKWNIECRIKGTPEPDKPDEMVKMVSGACMMGNDPTMYEGSVPSRAQIACLDKADCKEFKDCVSAKEAELKAELGK